MAGLMSKVAFASKVSILMRATSDDSNPTPGYLYEELSKITNECPEYCEYMVEFLVDRLKKKSVHVKLKVLLVLRNLLEKGNHDFMRSLRKHSEHVQEMNSINGTPDPLYGDSIYKSVRKTAADVLGILFDTDRKALHNEPMKLAGQVSTQQNLKMEGFGNSIANADTDESGIFKSIYDKIKDKVPVIKSAATILSPSPNNQSNLNSNGNDKNSVANLPPSTSWDFFAHSDYNKNETTSDFMNSLEVKQSTNSGINWLAKSKNYQPIDDISKKPQQYQIDLHENEKRIVEDIVKPLGIRNQPTKQQIDQFLKRCISLDDEFIVNRLADKLSDQDTRVQLRSLLVIESLLQSQLPNIKHLVKVSCVEKLNMFLTSSQTSSRNKAQKILQVLNKDEDSQLMPTEGVTGSPPVDQFHSLLDVSSQNSTNNDVFDGLQLQMPPDAQNKPKDVSKRLCENNFDHPRSANNKPGSLLEFDLDPFNTSTWNSQSNDRKLDKNLLGPNKSCSKENADSIKNFNADFFTTSSSNKNDSAQLFTIDASKISTVNNNNHHNNVVDAEADFNPRSASSETNAYEKSRMSEFNGFQTNTLNSNCSSQNGFHEPKDDFFSSFDNLKVNNDLAVSKPGNDYLNDNLLDNTKGSLASPVAATSKVSAGSSQINTSNLFEGLELNANTNKSLNSPLISPVSTVRTNAFKAGEKVESSLDLHLSVNASPVFNNFPVTPSKQTTTNDMVNHQFVTNGQTQYNNYQNLPSSNQTFPSNQWQSGNMQSGRNSLQGQSNQQYLCNNSPYQSYTPNSHMQFVQRPGYVPQRFPFNNAIKSQTFVSADLTNGNSTNNFRFISQKSLHEKKSNDSFSFVQDAMKASIKK